MLLFRNAAIIHRLIASDIHSRPVYNFLYALRLNNYGVDEDEDFPTETHQDFYHEFCIATLMNETAALQTLRIPISISLVKAQPFRGSFK